MHRASEGLAAPVPFNALAPEAQVEFFVHCQDLLIKHHPDSPFLCTTGNIKERVRHMRHFVQNYKGFCHQDDNVGALLNRIIVPDPRAPEHALRAAMYQAPAEHYNALSVDFVVFRDIKDCASLVKSYYDSKVQYVLFVRHNKVKLYRTLDFLQQILNMAVV